MSRWSLADVPDQSGRTVLITGANRGLGLRSAEALASRGARVLMACRDRTRATEALALVQASAAGAMPEVVYVDLGDLASVRAAAEAILALVDRVDVLLNNAAFPRGLPLARTDDDFEAQFGINHLGHFALCGLVLPALLRSPEPRVVAVSSLAHRFGRMDWDDLNWRRRAYNNRLAYGQSKIANLLYCAELDRKAGAHGVPLVATAAHPGFASTHRRGSGRATERGNPASDAVMAVVDRVLAQSDVDGALPQLYAATMPTIVSGDFVVPSGPMQLRGNPRCESLPAEAREPDNGARLWSISEELTGVTYHWAD